MRPSATASASCSFIRKSGRCTYGLDRFWSGCANRTQRRLQISLLGCIEVASGHAWTLEVSQTPPALSSEDDYPRMDFCMEQFVDGLDQLHGVRYMVADGEYARKKPFKAVTQHGKHLITKLRSEGDLMGSSSNLRYFADGRRRKGQRGRTPTYAGKVDFNLSLEAVNLARVEMQRQQISFNSYVRLSYNRFLVQRPVRQLGLEAKFDLRHPGIQEVIHIGRMAA